MSYIVELRPDCSQYPYLNSTLEFQVFLLNDSHDIVSGSVASPAGLRAARV